MMTLRIVAILALLATCCVAQRGGVADARSATTQSAGGDIRDSGNTISSADQSLAKLGDLIATLDGSLNALGTTIKSATSSGGDMSRSGNVTTGTRDWVMFGLICMLAIGDLIQFRTVVSLTREIKRATCNGSNHAPPATAVPRDRRPRRSRHRQHRD